jgi:S1-C subfamily serine protease
MEHLTKQQLVLLAILISFVTSLATGIVTVSLMDQGTFNITQVLNKVVERTIEKSVETAPAAAAVPSLRDITSQVSKSVVQFKPTNGSAESVTGLGIILSSDGLILTDKSNLSVAGEKELGKGMTAVLPGGEEVPIQVIQSEIAGDVAFVVALIPKNITLTPVTSAPNLASTKLGDKVYALSGKQSFLLEDGIVKRAPIIPEDPIETSITSSDLLLGSPLFNLDGQVIGFKTLSLQDKPAFHSLPGLKPIIPALTR